MLFGHFTMKTSFLNVVVPMLLLSAAATAQDSPAAAADHSAAPAASSGGTRAPGGATIGRSGGSASASGQRGPVTAPPQTPLPPPLRENITLTVKAELADGTPVNFALTGIGPQFQAVAVLPEPTGEVITSQPTIALMQAVVSEVAGGFQVVFSLSYRIPQTTESNGGTVTQYHNEATKSTVVAKLDVPTELAASNGKVVLVTLTKPAGK